MKLSLIAVCLAAAPALADDTGRLNPEEGGIADLRQDLVQRPEMAGYRCWVAYEIQKGGQHDDAFGAMQSCAASGNAASMILIAHAYENGLGAAPNASLATYWVKRAALLGDSVGMLHYGLALRDGRGLPRDEGQARFWLERAARAGDADAADALAEMPLSQGRIRPRSQD